MEILSAIFCGYVLSGLFDKPEPVSVSRLRAKENYEMWVSFASLVLWVGLVVSIWALFGIVAVCVAPFMIAYAYYLWIFCKWLYRSIPKWHKRLGPTYKAVGSYFWDDDSF